MDFAVQNLPAPPAPPPAGCGLWAMSAGELSHDAELDSTTRRCIYQSADYRLIDLDTGTVVVTCPQ